MPSSWKPFSRLKILMGELSGQKPGNDEASPRIPAKSWGPSPPHAHRPRLLKFGTHRYKMSIKFDLRTAGTRNALRPRLESCSTLPLGTSSSAHEFQRGMYVVLEDNRDSETTVPIRKSLHFHYHGLTSENSVHWPWSFLGRGISSSENSQVEKVYTSTTMISFPRKL